MSDTSRPLRRFTNVQLKNWKNFAFCDVAVGKRAFLFGPNASGKSNFLDVFRFLRDLAASGGGFQEAVGPAYSSRLIEFASSLSWWRPDVAAHCAESLRRFARPA